MKYYSCPICYSRLRKSRIQKDGFCLWSCCKCYFAEVFPKPSSKEIFNYYSKAYTDKHYKQTVEIGQKVKEKKFQWIIKQVEKYIKKDEIQTASILDIGCAYGSFLKVARDHGCQCLTGIEISEEAVGISQKQFGLDNVYAMTLKEYTENGSNHHSIITLFDVIEHISDVNDFMKDIEKILTEKGVVVFTTPDWRSFYARILGVNWPYFIPVEHLCFLTPFTIEYLSDAYGYKIITIKKARKYLSLEYFTQVATVLAPFISRILQPVIRIIPCFIKDFTFPFYLGEMLVILKRTKGNSND